MRRQSRGPSVPDEQQGPPGSAPSHARSRTNTEPQAEESRHDNPRSLNTLSPNISTTSYAHPVFTNQTANDRRNPIFIRRESSSNNFDIAPGQPISSRNVLPGSTSPPAAALSSARPPQTYPSTRIENDGTLPARYDSNQTRHTQLALEEQHPSDDTSRRQLTQPGTRFPAGYHTSIVHRPGLAETRSQDGAEMPPPFVHLIRSEIQQFASIPRGDFQSVLRLLSANPRLVDEDTGELIKESVQAFEYFNVHGVTQHGDTSKYAYSCIQQAIILRLLQHRLKETRRPRSQVIRDFLETLLDKKSEARHQLYKAFDQAVENARTRARDGKPIIHSKMAFEGAQQTLEPKGASTNQEYNTLLQGTTQDSISSRFSNFTIQGGDTAAIPAISTSRTQQSQPSAGQSQQSSMDLQQRHTENTADTSYLPTIHEQRSSTTQSGTLAHSTNFPNPAPQFGLTESSSRGSGRPLDADYYPRKSSYYKMGRVFAIVWTEPYNEGQRAGHTAKHTASERVSEIIHGQKVYSSIRRMVVVRERKGFCICIQISTYGGRGLTKFANAPEHIEAHSIIYMVGSQPQRLVGEPETPRQAIAVAPASPDQTLDHASRLCYSQPHTVQHTSRVKDVGWIVKDHLPYIEGYFNAVNQLK